MSKTISPLFILFEGIDGSGKTTQAGLLADHLNKSHETVFLREPTTAPSGKKIRDLILSGNSPDPRELTKLFIEDRIHDVNQNILPALANGTNVVLDRYYYSNAAYQSYTDEEMNAILRENRAHGFPEPDIIFYISIDPQESLKRMTQRDTMQCFEHIEELKRISANYKKLSAGFTLIDGSKSVESVHQQIVGVLKTMAGDNE